MISRPTMIGAPIVAAIIMGAAWSPLQASSHMDAPLITFDDAANTTDVYAFRSESNGEQYLTTALAVYPFEEPGIGPNSFRFDDRVRYDIHVALGDDAASGENTLTYRFAFKTDFQNQNTIRQTYLGPIGASLDSDGFFPNQNLRQSYSVTRIDNRSGVKTILGNGIVPPNNQGLLTPFYNEVDEGDMAAKEGVASPALLDDYTALAIASLDDGYEAFAGQRDDGFYADIQSIFDLDFSFGAAGGNPDKPFDSQGGFNVHTIVLNIPLNELEGAGTAGVYATTSRRMPILGKGQGKGGKDDGDNGKFVQVGRQGNPLFAEALVALVDKDLYNRTEPSDDEQFRVYAQDPVGDEGIEISRLLGLTPPIPGLVEAIYIPDVIRVDLTTGPARTPNDPAFNRLSVFGGDTLINGEGAVVFGGWPNGRRFGDDVVDIALIAVGASPAYPDAPDGPDFDGVTANDITYNDVFPYAATPLNGRSHGHHGR